MTVPVIINYRDSDRDFRNEKVMEAIRTMRNVDKVEKYAIIFSDMLVNLLNGAEIKQTINEAAKKCNMRNLDELVKSMGNRDPMVA